MVFRHRDRRGYLTSSLSKETVLREEGHKGVVKSQRASFFVQDMQFMYSMHTLEKCEQEQASHHQGGGGHQRKAALASYSGPQSQLLERAPRDRHASPFGTSFLLHERHVALKGQFCPMCQRPRNFAPE